ncbi:MAG: CPBP family intramembrane glutamic endopeptidase [Phycisphaerales bacterium]
MPVAPFSTNALHHVRRAALALWLLVPVPTIGALMALWLAPGPIGGAVYAFAKFWLLALPLAWTILIDRQPPLGVVVTPSRTRRGHSLIVGAMLGVVISAGIVGVFLLLRSTFGVNAADLRATATDAGFGSPANYLLFGAYLALVNSLLEEYVWRWFAFRAAASLMPPMIAVPVSALFFTLHHVVVLAAYFPVVLTALGSLGVFIGGCVWSGCFLRYGSIWPGYVSHAIVDVAILYVGWQLLFA